MYGAGIWYKIQHILNMKEKSVDVRHFVNVEISQQKDLYSKYNHILEYSIRLRLTQN